MTSKKTKLSVIIPVYNAQETIGRTLDSVLLQDTDFKFEIIVVDDGSTDESKKVVENYTKMSGNIRLLVNKENKGKGFSVMKAYEAALGDYFHILDADDYFISYNKLQKQVGFLDRNPEYIAVAHNSLMLFDDDRISLLSKNLQPRCYSYEEAVSNKFYFHTSSYMYRKIEEKLPDIFLLESMRGDSGLFFYHIFTSKKKVMYFPDISSIYHIHGHGIWSGMKNEEKYSLTVDIYRTYLDKIIVDKSTMEYKVWEKKLNILTERGKYSPSEYDKKSIDEVLSYCRDNLAKIYSPAIRAKAFKGMYGLKIVDQLCEACGRIILHDKNRQLTGRDFHNDKIAVLVSGFSPNGGGVFKEIKELIGMFINEDKSIEIYSSNQINSDNSVLSTHLSNPKIKYIETNESTSYSEQVEYLIDALYKSSPGRIYLFVSHHDIVLNSVIQRGLGRTVTLDYVFDHGLSTGIHNSSIDKFIIKTESQAEALSQSIPSEKFVLIPPFVEDAFNENPFQPLKNGVITTASASARQYKNDSNYQYAFDEIIPIILHKTGGIHIHFGPLDPDFKDRIFESIKRLKIEKDRFFHIDWADNFPKSLVEKGVDVFIASFPIPSALILVNVMMCGIPVIYHDTEDSLMTVSGDFCDRNQFSWNTPDDLYKIIEQINKQVLINKSASSRQFYETYNSREKARLMIIEERGHKINLQEHPRIKFHDLTESGFFQLDKGLFEKTEKMKRSDSGNPETSQLDNAPLEKAGKVNTRSKQFLKKAFSKQYADKRFEFFIMRPLVKLKGILGQILPSFANSFHRRMNDLTSEIQIANKRLSWQQKELLKEVSKIEDLRKEVGKIEELRKEIKQIKDDQQAYLKEARLLKGAISEVLWAQIYNNTIENCDWLINKSVSPGVGRLDIHFCMSYTEC
jgi:glycosyltransferase involved in cell wall biosynthesis